MVLVYLPARKSMAGDASSKPFLKKALRGVRAIICPNVRFYVFSPFNKNFLFHHVDIKMCVAVSLRVRIELPLRREQHQIKPSKTPQAIAYDRSFQLSVYRGSGGIQALMKNNARKLAEQDESTLVSSGIPYTIIRVGMLQDTPGGTQGFSFDKGSAEKGSLSKEDAAFICVEALDVVPQVGFTFEAVNGEEKVSDWKERLTRLMEKSEQKHP
ncbi:hypothetical protein POTOM_011653 [Populus tomentosa]|uniref:NAD(P)-binding domain-containing protein n=1 Tax=Populus tomentosa TaxID=118781 RepID=A0A8X8D8I0_POPTO|nr:hypothetical protein POTOM_011653 [Populus tomentosa]